MIAEFLRGIGLTVEFGPVQESFLPGVMLVAGGLLVDAEGLLYPGDLLHEAGHLAVMAAERRGSCPVVGDEMGEEIGAQCWSYAAAIHLGAGSGGGVS